ncbi:M42 family peptidase [uncultured Eubacterium sp.]|uniref:M42 family metallopeptidase n=1 Tax=uncultured Eubacterium sp. TaxID=165185 RepID=UPI0025CDBA7D|nr:M42 family peptidase [uncultured Eubacterium sp.]
MLRELCLINGTSGDEGKVRDYIITQIMDYCEYSVDNLGSIIAYKKGKKAPKQKISINAHMDEVGFIVTGITDDGYLRFTSVGGIDSRVCLDRIVTVGKKAVKGVIGDKAFHLLSSDEKDRCPSFDDLLIDIGVTSKDEAEQYVSLGDFAYFDCDYVELGNGYIKAKALDDRIGCMLMIELIKSELEYDTVFCFNVQEEVGLRGSKCTSYAVDADIAIVLESTTAADLDGVSGANRVCVLGDGPVISFMDNRTIYDRELFELGFTVAKENNIPAQTKTAVAGGNDAGAIQTSGDGARVMAISLPTRYIHSGASVVKASDIDETRRLLKALLPKLTD